MALATRCPHCDTTFRVASDQLKLRGGIVRCGACSEVFDGNTALIELDVLVAPPPAPAAGDPAPMLGVSAAAPEAPFPTPETHPVATEPAPESASDLLAESAPELLAESAPELLAESAPELLPELAPHSAPEPSASDAFDVAIAMIEAQQADTVVDLAEPPYILDFDTTLAPFDGAPVTISPTEPEPEPEQLVQGAHPAEPESGADSAPGAAPEFDVDPDAVDESELGPEPELAVANEPGAQSANELEPEPEPEAQRGPQPEPALHGAPEIVPAPIAPLAIDEEIVARALPDDGRDHESAIQAPLPLPAPERTGWLPGVFRTRPMAATEAPPLAPESTEAADVKPDKTAPADAEPVDAEPANAPPAQGESEPAAPTRNEPTYAEPPRTDLADAGVPQLASPSVDALAVAPSDAPPPPATQAPLAPTHAAMPGREPDDAASDNDEPDFVRRARHAERSGRRRRLAMGAASALLLLTMAAQVTTNFRVELAARYPQLKPALVSACALLGCRVELPAQIDLLEIESGELQPVGASTFSLVTALRNQGNLAQSWPHIELALTDGNDKPLLRRVFKPGEYLPAGTDPTKGFAARSEQAVKLYFKLSALQASGYHIAVFYP
jgi:predicted Zn finger-like uncharacterized protein